MERSLLLNQIEQCRHELIKLSNLHELNSAIVIQTSKRLDDLLNQYQMRHNQTLVS